LPDIKYGQVIKVYDGDTITIATPLFNGDEVPHIKRIGSISDFAE
jgi:ethanolamine utilization protein EutA (predicted chaperonin)